MSKKRIVHYIANLKDGGAQTQLILLCNNIDITKYEVFIVCWDKTSTLPVKDHVHFHVLQRGNKYNLLSFFKQVFKVSKQLKPDVAHLWLPEMITLPAAIACRIMNVPIINSERRLPSTNIFKFLWYRDHTEYLIHMISDIVTTNFPIPIKRKSLFNFLLRKKGVTVYNGISLLGADYQVNSFEEFTVIYCGRFVTQKNVLYLIKAVHELIELEYKIKLVLYGEGELYNELYNYLVQNKIEDYFEFKGYKKNWKIEAKGGGCFVLPTSREGMPNVLFEAASIGLPLISTNIEEIQCHFTTNHDSILVDPKDEKQLKDAIISLYSDNLFAKKLAGNAYTTIEKYSIDRMVNKYQDMYEQLLKKNKTL